MRNKNHSNVHTCMIHAHPSFPFHRFMTLPTCHSTNFTIDRHPSIHPNPQLAVTSFYNMYSSMYVNFRLSYQICQLFFKKMCFINFFCLLTCFILYQYAFLRFFFIIKKKIEYSPRVCMQSVNNCTAIRTSLLQIKFS